MINFGNGEIGSIMFGSIEIESVMLGSEKIFPMEEEEPVTEINEYLERYNWLQADGSKYISAYRPIAGTNINKTNNITLRAIVKVDSLTSAIGAVTALSGGSTMYAYNGVDTRYRWLSIAFKRLDANTFSVGYFGCNRATECTEFFDTYHIGDTLTIEGTEKTLTINGVTYNKTVAEEDKNLSMVAVLHSATVLGDKPYNAQIARFEYIANGTTYSSLIPAKIIKELPVELAYSDKTPRTVGTVGMWDIKNQKFLTSNDANYWSVNNYSLDGSQPEPDEPEEPEEPQPDENLEYVDLYKYINISKNAYLGDIPYNSGSYNAEFETELIVDNLIEGNYYSLVGCKATIDGAVKVVNSLQLVPLNSEKTTYGVTYTVLNDSIPVDNPRGEINLGETVHIKATNTKLTVNGVDYPITDGVDISKGFTNNLFYNNFNSNNSLRFKGRVKYFKAWNKGALVADLYPAITIKEMPLDMCKGYKPTTWTVVPAGTAGMWNKATNRLHINANRNDGSIDIGSEQVAKTTLMGSRMVSTISTLSLTDDVNDDYEQEDAIICFN